MPSWLSSADALAALGTKPQSLYASVSRGRIRTKPDPADPRRRLYHRDDIERLAGHRPGRRRAETVAAEAIRWGDPVLPSAITSIAGGRLFYRGRDAAALADGASLEEVAALLWEGPVPAFPTIAVPEEGSPLRRAFVALAERAAAEPPALDREASALRADAAAVVGALAGAVGARPGEALLHRRLAAAWRRPEAAGLLRQALVLLADHELNASAFAARVTVSTGASLSAAALSGLATLTGPRHGGAAGAVATLARSIERDGPAAIARTWAARQQPLAGFGHRLYPDGDPRARALLPGFPLPPAYAALAALGRELSGEEPNIDFALAALSAAYDLPADAPLLLFALARSVGWLAHALEQLAAGTPIRPRATYVGPPPAAAP